MSNALLIALCSISMLSSGDFQSQDEAFFIFLNQWKALFEQNDPELIAEQVQFPLREAQVAVGRYGQGGLTKEEFITHFDRIFADFLPLLKNANNAQVRKLDKGHEAYKAPSDAMIYQLSLTINDEEGESTLAFLFWKVDGQYKLRYLIFAG